MVNSNKSNKGGIEILVATIGGIDVVGETVRMAPGGGVISAILGWMSKGK